MGVGKTEAIITTIQALLAADANAIAAVFVPDHTMSAELAVRMRAGLSGVEVEIWRGADQPDPTASPSAPFAMCRRGVDAKAVQQAGGTLADLCGSKKRGYCQHHPEHPVGADCGYIAQGRRAGTVRVWIFAHALLSRGAPVWLRRPGKAAADIIVIDEAFWRAMLGGPVSVPLAALDVATWPTVPDAAADIAPGFADQRLRRVLGLLARVTATAANHDRLTRAALQAAGLSAQDCRLAIGFALRCKAPLPKGALPTSGTGKVAGLLGPLAADNRRVLQIDRLLRVAGAVLDGKIGGAAIHVFDGTAGRELRVRWREPIHADWIDASGGIVHADATMQTDIARVFLPALVASPPQPIAAPHMHVTQVVDRALGYSALIAATNSGVSGQKAADSNARRLLRALAALADQYQGKGAAGGADVLAVMPKALEAAFSGHLPGNVGTLHFGKLRGQDAYRGVAALVVVSRPLPPPNAVEDTAEIIFGRDVARLAHGKFYGKKPGVRAMADGSGLSAEVAFHPDPDVEAVRWASCEAELIQAVGRGRGVRRTAADPLDVYLLTDVPIAGVLVNSAVMLDDLMRDLAGPVRSMVRVGVLPRDWAGREAMLTRLGFIRPAARKRPGDACRQWFRDNPDDGRLLAGAVAGVAGDTRVAVKSPKETFLWRFHRNSRQSAAPAAVRQDPVSAPTSWPSFRYRLSGARQAGTVLVSPDHGDPRAAVERAVGLLDLFDLVTAAGSAPVQPRQRVTANTGQTLAPVAEVPQMAPPNPVLVPVLVHSAAPIQPIEPPRTSLDGAAVTARLDSEPVELLAVLNVLEGSGAITRAAHRRHMDRFRLDRGPRPERQGRALERLAAVVGWPGVIRAARAAAAAKIGVPIPPHMRAPNGAEAEAA